VRIVTIDAVFIDIVLIGVNPRNSFALTGGIWKQRMTAQTEATTSVDHQMVRFIRMLKGWSVAILTGDNAVQIFGADVNLFTMAFRAVFMHLLFPSVTVFERLILPDFLIGFVVKAVHEAVFARAKTLRHVKRPEQQNYGDNANDHE